ncbi:substrate-binding periplasmic protein [Alkalimarinus alittae]|uniref:Transporter substrate-binding domain-containing protein n=1 Tax=Alkalimarinus alittae TaxID=2961619 RepID=A0ABY6N253_9ALTE|nr:transporter substrate-binding domain-containing protein [Alkalimarinus alittae]UZE96092.1 transporter substrate-binding domain-containing protein [Alkalimarinus alittae]
MTVFVAQAETVITVGGYEFPPFVSSGDIQQPNHGITIDLIEHLNQVQSEYTFKYFPTSSKRRYMDFSVGRYDLIMFENSGWGWAEQPVEASNVFMHGAEVYIAYNRPERDQQFFDDIASKRIVGMLGYHYGFANFNSDEDYLSEHFNVLLSTDHLRNIRLILTDRPELAEIAVVTQSFLNDYLAQNPKDREKLLISNKLDQEYLHRMLVRKGAAISVGGLNHLIDSLQTEGIIAKLEKKYGIKRNRLD